MTRSFFAGVLLVVCGMAGSAQAATLNGLFNVTAVNVLDRDSTQSQATAANYTAALAAANETTAGYETDTFTYDGFIDFETLSGNATTVFEWLQTGGGILGDLDGAFGGLQLSKGSITSGTATTSFFMFTAHFLIGPSDFTVDHDDGIAIFEVGNLLGGFVGPNSVRTTLVPGFGGGSFDLLYVATNSNPSILNVDVAPVPLPAALPLLAAGLGGLGVMRLRRKAA